MLISVCGGFRCLLAETATNGANLVSARYSLELLLHLLPLPLLHPYHLQAHAKHGHNMVSSPPQTPRPTPCWKALLASYTLALLSPAAALVCSLVYRPAAFRSESTVDFSQVRINPLGFRKSEQGCICNSTNTPGLKEFLRARAPGPSRIGGCTHPKLPALAGKSNLTKLTKHASPGRSGEEKPPHSHCTLQPR